MQNLSVGELVQWHSDLAKNNNEEWAKLPIDLKMAFNKAWHAKGPGTIHFTAFTQATPFSEEELKIIEAVHRDDRSQEYFLFLYSNNRSPAPGNYSEEELSLIPTLLSGAAVGTLSMEQIGWHHHSLCINSDKSLQDEVRIAFANRFFAQDLKCPGQNFSISLYHPADINGIDSHMVSWYFYDFNRDEDKWKALSFVEQTAFNSRFSIELNKSLILYPKQLTDVEMEPKNVDSPLSPTKIPHFLNFNDFKKAREPKYSLKYSAEFYPNKSTRRNESIALPEKSTSETQDPSVTIRQDAKPLEKELIADYLPRVFKSYRSEEGLPRGFVFSGLDFRCSIEGVHPAVNFLNQYMGLLKQVGIKKIFLEQQVGFNFYSNEPENDKTYLLYQYFSSKLKEIPAKVQQNDSIRMIYKKAKEEGLEVIGAEILWENFSTDGCTTERRIANFNANAASFIREINEPFVVFVGAGHGKLRRNRIPGLSDYLDCPCIGLGSSNLRPFIGPGTHRFVEGRDYSVDAVFAEFSEERG